MLVILTDDFLGEKLIVIFKTAYVIFGGDKNILKFICFYNGSLEFEQLNKYKITHPVFSNFLNSINIIHKDKLIILHF